MLNTPETRFDLGTRLPDGVKMSAELTKSPWRIRFGKTSFHEALHAAAAWFGGTILRRVSRNPGPGYYGITELAWPDVVAAAAPAAFGCGGVGHDLNIVKLLRGTVGGAMAAAKARLAGHMDEVESVASALEEKGTLNGPDVDHAIKRVNAPQELIIKLWNHLGEKRQFVATLDRRFSFLNASQVSHFIEATFFPSTHEQKVIPFKGSFSEHTGLPHNPLYYQAA